MVDSEHSRRVLTFALLFLLSAVSVPTQLFGFELPEDEESGQPVKYKAEGELSEDNIKTFAKDLLAKTLSPHYKSAPEPEKVIHILCYMHHRLHTKAVDLGFICPIKGT